MNPDERATAIWVIKTIAVDEKPGGAGPSINLMESQNNIAVVNQIVVNLNICAGPQDKG